MRATRKPVYSPNPVKNCWVLELPLRVDIGPRQFIVPASFESDIASIPRFAWPFVGPPATPRIDRAAWLHDWLYEAGPGLPVNRKAADSYFLDVMRMDGAEKPRLKWLAVRAFGWLAWYRIGDRATKVRPAPARWALRLLLRLTAD